MIPLKDLISYWQARQQAYPPKYPYSTDLIVSSTIAYLNAYNQAHLMLKDLAGELTRIETS